MPRVKNVDCAACNQRVTYEYAIHRQTFMHKMHSAKYNDNQSMIYYDSVDLDKSPERINVQTLRLYNKEADQRTKNLKQLKRDAAKTKLQQHSNFEKKRKIAASANKHLLPKAKLNVLQTKLAIEAEMIYKQQLASLKPFISVPSQNVDDDYDLHDFKLTPKKAKKHCLATNSKQQKPLISANLISLDKSLQHGIVPLANSTQIHTTFTTDTHTDNDSNNSAFASAVIKNISFLHSTNATSQKLQCCNTPTHHQKIHHTPLLDTSDIQLADHFRPDTIQNISQIPLPQGSNRLLADNSKTSQRLSHTSLFDSKATENISFFTSFYIQPTIPTIHIKTPNDNHVYCYSPPKSPDNIITTRKSIQTLFKLNRIDLTTLDTNTSTHKCRICRSDINMQLRVV